MPRSDPTEKFKNKETLQNKKDLSPNLTQNVFVFVAGTESNIFMDVLLGMLIKLLCEILSVLCSV